MRVEISIMNKGACANRLSIVGSPMIADCRTRCRLELLWPKKRDSTERRHQEEKTRILDEFTKTGCSLQR